MLTLNWQDTEESRAEALPPARLPFFGQYDLHNGGLAYMRMIRTAKHKYVRHFKANFLDELYDLESDPGETRNLLRRRHPRPAVLEDLRAQLRRWQESINDPVLEGN